MLIIEAADQRMEARKNALREMRWFEDLQRVEIPAHLTGLAKEIAALKQAGETEEGVAEVQVVYDRIVKGLQVQGLNVAGE